MTRRPAGHLIIGVLLLALGTWLIWRLWIALTVVLLAVILAVGLMPFARSLEQRRVPRGLAVVALYLMLVLPVSGLAYGAGQAVSRQAQELLIRLRPWLEAMVSLTGASGALSTGLMALPARALGAAALAMRGAAAGLLVLLIAYYLIVDGDRLWTTLLDAVPKDRREMIAMLGTEMAWRLRGYLKGLVFSGLAIGLLTWLGLMLLGIPYALLFGLLAGVLEAIPFLGPIVASLGPVLLALGISPAKALLTLIFFVVLQQAEDKLLVPRLQSRATGLHPLAVILGAVVLGSLFGLTGVVLAIPLSVLAHATLNCVVACFLRPERAAAWHSAHLPSGSAFSQRRPLGG